MFKKALSILLIFACIFSFSIVFADEVQSDVGSSATSALIQAGQTVSSSVYNDLTKYNYIPIPIMIPQVEVFIDKIKTVSFQGPWIPAGGHVNVSNKAITYTFTIAKTFSIENGSDISFDWKQNSAKFGIKVSGTVEIKKEIKVDIKPNEQIFIDITPIGKNHYFKITKVYKKFIYSSPNTSEYNGNWVIEKVEQGTAWVKEPQDFITRTRSN
ncbi:hypothetical protein ELD05_13515 [Caldicellulosiruptor changbaiensis]|uniref:Uncharacterized protein n=1 Tax=Caldicellulosiruptor changbaiensis TaxID=1222016 RepID=A0A3T0D8Q7_9FIRM|nr:hypothetical protein [Caldicellulosiruptor changbaiensis]AZT91530.1 hypothetical protein ELD05_13515 [Caldicellulosiruptor changbaiensis]